MSSNRGKAINTYDEIEGFSYDTSIPIRRYLGVSNKKDNKKLVWVHLDQPKNVDKIYVVTAMTQFIIKNNNFKVSCTAEGEVYVVLEDESDAALLDDQSVLAFDVNIWYERCSSVGEECRLCVDPAEKSFLLFQKK